MGAAALVLAAAAAAAAAFAVPAAPAAEGPHHRTLVELFTSQG